MKVRPTLCLVNCLLFRASTGGSQRYVMVCFCPPVIDMLLFWFMDICVFYRFAWMLTDSWSFAWTDTLVKNIWQLRPLKMGWFSNGTTLNHSISHTMYFSIKTVCQMCCSCYTVDVHPTQAQMNAGDANHLISKRSPAVGALCPKVERYGPLHSSANPSITSAHKRHTPHIQKGQLKAFHLSSPFT